MKKNLLLTLIVTLSILFQVNPNGILANRLPASPANKIDADLQRKIDALQPGQMLSVIVTLQDQADLTALSNMNGRARQKAAITALRATAEATQRPINALLQSRRLQGQVNQQTSFWGFNGLAVTATSQVILELAARPDVLKITPDDVSITPASILALNAPEPNLSAINTPALWNLGFYGQGVVVANMDSGVDISHPDLASRWRGGSNSWYDPYGQHPTTPTDLSGHGTWTMGVMVGGDAGGSSIGVAPQAQWIAVKIFNDAGSSTATAIHQGFQWLLDPDGNPDTADAPNVVDNSWAYGNPGCNLEFQLDLRALRAVGILPVFAAGNYGPGGSTSVSPANYPEAFAVGAVDNTDQIYASSSRGPSACGETQTIYPEIVAPGVNVKTTNLFGQYYNATGTSMSAPQAAGVLALLLNAYPNLTAYQQYMALTSGAVDRGAAGPDNTFGFGRLNALASYQWLQAGGSTVTPTPTPTPLPTLLPTATPAPTATSTPVPATTLHVGDLDRSSTLSGSKWNASVTVYVHDNNEKLVANATVTGKWTNGATGTVSCVTNSSGTCLVSKTGLSAKTTSVTFTLTGVTHATLTYKSSANHDPDGDSSGTSITVSKP